MALESTVRARVDAQLKKEVEAIFSELGLSTSQAITLFLKRVKRERGIPFDLKLPNETTLRVLHEAQAGINMEETSIEETVAEHQRGCLKTVS